MCRPYHAPPPGISIASPTPDNVFRALMCHRVRVRLSSSFVAVCLVYQLSASVRRGLGGRGATTAREAHALPDGQTREHNPVEKAKDDAGLRALAKVVAVAVGNAHEDSHGNAAGEPEEGCESEQGQSGDGDVQRGSHSRRDGNVHEDEDGPNGGEEHEFELRGRSTPPGAMSLAHDIAGETKLNDQEQRRKGVDNGEFPEAAQIHDGGFFVCRATMCVLWSAVVVD